MEKIINAQIKSAFLGIEDHGIFTFGLDLELDTGYCQGYGGYSLEGVNCWKSLKSILDTVGVRDWKDLEHKYIRVKYKTDKYNEPIYAIGHIIKNKWFTLEKE